MKRDAIDFERDRVSALFRKLLIPTLLGTISISAVTACHAGSGVHDLSHHTGLLPQKKMPEMNDTALASCS
jgi:hypothetical protein